MFSHPEALLLFGVLPLLFLLKRRKRQHIQFSADLGAGSMKGILPLVFRVAAISLVILALAGPRSEYILKKTSRKARSIVLLLDVSGSMAGSTWQAAQRAGKSFINNREDDRLAIVFFSYEGWTVTPFLTKDHELLKEFVDKGFEYSPAGGGTMFSSGIASGLAVLLNQHYTPEATEAIISKIEEEILAGRIKIKEEKLKGNLMVMITDGLPNNEDFPLLLGYFEVLHRLGIKFYLCSINHMPNELKNAVVLTGGQWYVDKDPMQWENRLIEEISKNEKEEYLSQEVIETKPLARSFILFAICLILTEWVMVHLMRDYFY